MKRRPAGFWARRVVITAGLVAGLLTGSASANGLWSSKSDDETDRIDSFTQPIIRECDPQVAKNGCTAENEASGPFLDQASATDNVLAGLKFTKDDAAKMAKMLEDGDPNPTLVKSVVLYGSGLLGNQGVNYSWDKPVTTPGTWAGDSSHVVYRSDSGDCGTGPVDDDHLLSHSGTLIPATYQNTAHTSKSASWLICVINTFDGLATYTNTVTATSTDGTSHSSSLRVNAYPNPDDEPDTPIEISVSFTQGGAVK